MDLVFVLKLLEVLLDELSIYSISLDNSSIYGHLALNFEEKVAWKRASGSWLLNCSMWDSVKKWSMMHFIGTERLKKYFHYKHSDWLFKKFQPIGVLKTSIE